MNGLPDLETSVLVLAAITLIGVAGNLAQILEWWQIRQEHQHPNTAGLRSAPSGAQRVRSHRAHRHLPQAPCEKRLEQILSSGIDRALSLGYSPDEIEQACAAHISAKHAFHKKGA